jgi:hypothetical protein
MIARSDFTAVLLAAALVTTSAHAKSPRTCAPTTLVGGWHSILVGEMVCTINIAHNGSVSSSCLPTFPAFDQITTPLTGTLTIDRACKVTGTLTWALDGNPTLPHSITAWISADGSRVTGWQTYDTGGKGGVQTYPFELIEGN